MHSIFNIANDISKAKAIANFAWNKPSGSLSAEDC